MRKALLLAAIGLLSACATPRLPVTGQPWLVGNWVVVGEGGSPYPDACESDAPVHYDARGTYSMDAEAGTWRLEGDRLTESPTAGETAEVDRPTNSRVDHSGPDEFRKFFADGRSLLFRRCPD